jgi:hypothetical protein
MNGEALVSTSTETLEFAEGRLAVKVLVRRLTFGDPLVEALLAVRSELERRRERSSFAIA